jgi:hypothetical protein
MILQNYVYIPSEMMNYFSSFTYLFVLLFVSDSAIDFLKPTIVAARIISIATIVVTFVIISNPILIPSMFKSKIVEGTFRIMIRPILGYSFLSVFHLSASTIIIPFGYALANFFYRKKIIALFECILYVFALFFSGTRANILACILVFFGIYLYYIYYLKKNKLLFVCFLSIIAMSMFILIFLLLNDPTSGSSTIKEKHVVSILELLKNNMNILSLGNGPGSLYYTEGFQDFTTRSELSYYELIRSFGLFSAIVFCLVYFFPAIIIFNGGIFCFSVSISYLAYLFIAGTNPLLIVPQGFTMLLVAYNCKFNSSKFLMYTQNLKGNI